MEVIQLTILLFFCYICQCETSVTICGDPKYPYKTPDNYCANFSEICFKKDDPTCNNIQNVCKQCPLSNYSAIIYLDIQNLKNEMTSVMSKFEQMMKNINYLSDKFTLLKYETVQTNKEMLQIKTKVEVLGIIIILITLIGLVVLVLENRFKLITKLICLNKNKKYELLRSRKMRSDTKEFQELNQKVSEIFSKFEEISNQSQRLSEMFSKVEEISNQMQRLSDQNSIVKFKYESKKFNLKVYDNDCVIEIKKKICSQLSNTNDNDYKIMKLKYNGNILDDNRYLLPYITDRNISVDCEIDQSIIDQEIIVIKVRDIYVPELLQMHRNNTVGDLRRNIFIYTDVSDCLIIKESNIIENKLKNIKSEILKDESTIGECKFTDGDFVKIIKRTNGKLAIKSILEQGDSLIIKYSNTEFVSSIKEKAANKFGSDPKDFHLFLKNQYLDEDKYIFEYNIDENSKIKYCCLMKLEKNINIGEYIDKGYYSKLYKGENFVTKKITLIMTFELKIINKNNSKLFTKGLIKYQIIKDNPRFVKLCGVYYDKDSLYVEMEYLSGRTLTLLKSAEITEDKIIKWSIQILEGIKYLHDKDAIHKNLKPYEIFIDENENLKMHSFCFCEYLDEIESPDEKFTTFESSEISRVYFSPEIREKKPCTKQTDVWSFGVLLVDLINKKSQSINLNEIDQIVKNGKVKEALPEWINDEIKDMIESCLRIDPNKRSTVDQLLQHKCLKN